MTQASEKRIQVVEILSNLEDVPALEELLTATGYEPSSYSDLEEQRGTTYLLASDMSEARAWREAIEGLLPEWSDCLSGAPLTVQTAELLEEDWCNSWKRNFHTFRASDRLVIRPSWERYGSRDAAPGRDDEGVSAVHGRAGGAAGSRLVPRLRLRLGDSLDGRQAARL